jgi:molybdopterin/thiamine biosynthesis adenylyltransferase
MNPFLHETFYRGSEAMARLAEAHITVCGAGALGGQLVEQLVRQGARRLRIIDFDRVEAHNIGSQVYDEGDIGALKVEALRSRCFRATSAEIEAINKRMTSENIAKLLRGADLVCDTFDNRDARRLVTEHCLARSLPCLHLGVNADYGEVRWNERYRAPEDVGLGNACDYPLARNLSLVVVALGCEALLRWLLEGRRESYSFTLRDLAINHE